MKAVQEGRMVEYVDVVCPYKYCPVAGVLEGDWRQMSNCVSWARDGVCM